VVSVSFQTSVLVFAKYAFSSLSYRQFSLCMPPVFTTASLFAYSYERRGSGILELLLALAAI
jgi:hypothetical protein